MSMMIRKVYDALIDAGANETKDLDAAKSVVRNDTDIA